MKRIGFVGVVALVFLSAGLAWAVEPVVPPGVSVYTVEAHGLINGYFTEVSGIGSETEVFESRVVGDAITKLPGATSFNEVVLIRGLTANMEASDWRNLVEDGDIASARVSVLVTLYDPEMTAIAQWVLSEAWPSKITYGVNSDGVAIEMLTLACNSIERIQ
jgi:phage tail-like protein